MSIHYFSEEVNFTLKSKIKTSAWLKRVIEQEGYKLAQLNYIFCSDVYLYTKNISYLGHDTLTDVITFDYAIKEKSILGDVYISIERVKENARQYNQEFQAELYTVMVHGLLHLLAYNDLTTPERKTIRNKEAFYLKQFFLY